jgi:hypothetical protein
MSECQDGFGQKPVDIFLKPKTLADSVGAVLEEEEWILKTMLQVSRANRVQQRRAL